MNKILLITTKGCDGCAVARNNIKQAIDASKKKIIFEEIDVSKVNKVFLRTLKVRDFPTTIIYKEDEVRVTWGGSVPVIVVQRWIDVHFK